jgi:ribonucleoside-triphosphate reductase
MTVQIKGRDITINDGERQEMEQWTRIVGYFRPIDHFNVGRKQEAKDRTWYKESNAYSHIN